MKKAFVNIVKILITAAILGFLYQKGLLDFSRVGVVLTNPPVVILSLLLLSTTTIVSVLRWRLLLMGQDLKISRREALRLTMIGVFFNTAIPGAVSGDLVKGYYVVRQQPSGKGKIKAFTTLLLDRILGVSALIFVSFVSMLASRISFPLSPVLQSLSYGITLMFCGVVTFYLLILLKWPFSNRLPRLLRKYPGGDYLARLYESFRAYERCRHFVLKGMAISIVIHCILVGVFVLLAQVLGGFEQIPITQFFVLAPLGLLVTAVPVAPAGLGTGHAAFFGLFQLVGSSRGADLFTAFVSFQIIISLIGGLFYLRYRREMPKGETAWETNGKS